ncbi:cytochrome c biogenesis protein CcdA [Actinotalea sp. AC32]|nr:cytochrome c biogenesis protein CcdA [Actinotalea sp. AC32]
MRSTGWLVIAFGVMQALGRGFDLRRLVPGSGRLEAAGRSRDGLPRTFLLGTVSGVAGFCAGPILGAVLTLAAASGSAVLGGTMLAVYAAGMVLPLVGIAWLWARRGAGVGRSFLRGREVAVGRVRLHSTSLVTGLLLVAVGVVFATTNGMTAAPELVPTHVQADLQDRVVAWGSAVPDVVTVGVLALGALALWWLVRRRATASSREHAEDRP